MTSGSRSLLFICSQLWTGGPQIFIRRISAGLKNQGWSTFLLLTGTDNEVAFDSTNWPGTVIHIPVQRTYLKLGNAVAHHLTVVRPDIVIGCAIHAGITGCRTAALNGFRTRFVDVVHSDISTEYERVKLHGSSATGILGVSDTIVHKLQQILPDRKEVIHRIYCPVDHCTPRRRPKGTSISLIWIGRIEQSEKRVFDLAHTAALLKKRGVDFELTIVGDGPDKKELIALLAKLNVGENCKLLGHLDSNAVQKQLSRHDVFLLPSAVEGLPIALVEAMAHGLVPVATRLSGIEEIVDDGINGFLSDVGDCRALSEKLSILAKRPDLLQDMGEAALRVLDRHSAEAATRAFLSVLEHLLSHPNPIHLGLHDEHTRVNKLLVEPIVSLKRRLLGQEVH